MNSYQFGTITVIDGPSGSGKATLLFGRMLRESLRRQALLKAVGRGKAPSTNQITAIFDSPSLPPVVPWFNNRNTGGNLSIAEFLNLEPGLRRLDPGSQSQICGHCQQQSINTSFAIVPWDEFVASLLEKHSGSRIAFSAVLSVPAQAETDQQLAVLVDRCSKQGFDRWIVDGIPCDTLPVPFPGKKSSLEAIIVRLALTDSGGIEEASQIVSSLQALSIRIRALPDLQLIASFSSQGVCPRCGAVGEGVQSCTNISLVARELLDAKDSDLQAIARLLVECDLAELELSRKISELSRAERTVITILRLAISPLQNVLYLFDEPCAGLHPRQVTHIARLLKRIASASNAVMVSCADGALDQNGAASSGTTVNVQPSIKCPCSSQLTIIRTTFANTRNRDINFCVPGLNVVGGPAGSGKRMLLEEILTQAITASINGDASPYSVELATKFSSVRSTFGAGEVIAKRDSTVGSTLGVLAPLRRLFAKLPLAAMRGIKESAFVPAKTNHSRYVDIEPELWRYSWSAERDLSEAQYPSALHEIKFRGLNLAQLLRLPVQELEKTLQLIPFTKPAIKVLNDLGLMNLAFGIPTWVLSHGERSLLRLAQCVMHPGSGVNLYLLDHPTRWLDGRQVDAVIEVLQELVRLGHTVISADNSPALIQAAACYVSLDGPNS